MKCLVTGGAGFIGSNICNKLQELGYFVIAFDNMSAGRESNLNKGIRLIKDDVLNIFDWEKELKDIDIIFNNMASKKTVCLRNPKRDCDVNAKGTLELLLFAEKHYIRFIHASTGSVYGETKIFPTHESAPLHPNSYYGISKLAGENYVTLFSNRIEAVILRYFHVYGKNQDDGEYGGVVAKFIKALLNNKSITVYGDGNQVRTFTHIDDIVNINLRTIFKGDGEIYNCSSGYNYTLNQLISFLENHFNKSFSEIIYKEAQEGDIYNFNVDNSKIINDFGIQFKKLNIDWV